MMYKTANYCKLCWYIKYYKIDYVYIGDSDVLVARDRLKGALRELLHHSDTGSSAESDDSPISDYKHPMKKM